MKKFALYMAGFCAAAAGWIVLSRKRVQPVQQLAHQLEVAWQDHHTVA